ncbi:MAG: hypothetical protein Ct9H300mP11_20330 [Chloroflexota bacterium]|nr:MAG: hypothetical protein Ct9H300mP11_20330 [Chloroflexota bacterium]
MPEPFQRMRPEVQRLHSALEGQTPILEPPIILEKASATATA